MNKRENVKSGNGNDRRMSRKEVVKIKFYQKSNKVSILMIFKSSE